MRIMGHCTEEHEAIVKQANWYYDKMSGDLPQYLKAAKSYHSAIDALLTLQPDDIRALISKYVPTDMQNEVYRELLRKAAGKNRYV